MKQTISSKLSRWTLIAAMTAATAGCAGGSLTPREKGAGIGALGGAAIANRPGGVGGFPPSRHGRRNWRGYWTRCGRADRRLHAEAARTIGARRQRPGSRGVNSGWLMMN